MKRLAQFAVSVEKMRRTFEFHLRNIPSAAIRNLGVYYRCYVQNNIIVSLVCVVLMPEPV